MGTDDGDGLQDDGSLKDGPHAPTCRRENGGKFVECIRALSELRTGGGFPNGTDDNSATVYPKSRAEIIDFLHGVQHPDIRRCFKPVVALVRRCPAAIPALLNLGIPLVRPHLNLLGPDCQRDLKMLTFAIGCRHPRIVEEAVGLASPRPSYGRSSLWRRRNCRRSLVSNPAIRRDRKTGAARPPPQDADPVVPVSHRSFNECRRAVRESVRLTPHRNALELCMGATGLGLRNGREGAEPLALPPELPTAVKVKKDELGRAKKYFKPEGPWVPSHHVPAPAGTAPFFKYSEIPMRVGGGHGSRVTRQFKPASRPAPGPRIASGTGFACPGGYGCRYPREARGDH
ncbi:hypothetical protein GGX14DRAFT_676203 [Mycena pura]|uniref:Uncharacterized protein n=1 Tax=Mycena pura TaxID=153505 RepID=A0AAD6VSY6_9AGAR|nr:hypothetical protein GGX14DRAFT_676203 [Mycena pura]